MVLVGFFVSQKKTQEATSHIHGFDLEPDERGDDETPGWVKLTGNDDGTVTLERGSLRLREGETCNLVATVIDDKITIQEKRGKTVGGAAPERTYTGRVTVKFVPAGSKVYVRYDSAVTGQWCKFSFTNSPRRMTREQLRY